MKYKKIISVLLAASMMITMAGCSNTSGSSDSDQSSAVSSETGTDIDSDSADTSADGSTASSEATDADTACTYAEKSAIEDTLNLKNNSDQTWTYSSDADAWVLSIVSAVTNPEIEDEQGVSVCVPGAYVTGIDTDGDGKEDVVSTDTAASDGVNGSLVIDYNTEITSPNGQTYTADTAPVIINTGAAGYASSTNTLAGTTYAEDGYINVSCGNRGKQDTATDADGNTYYTGDAPCCLVDQKDAIRYVKYNILLGNLPGSVDSFISTGGSGGGAHATMVASTGNNSDYFDYEIEAGAVGVYPNDDGNGYSTTVTIDGEDVEISDGVWGCVAYSAITSLAEADMAMAFEYYMDTDYDFNTDFQAKMAEYLSHEYMEYINGQNLSVAESAVGFDLNNDGDTGDTVPLTIEYDEEKYADTNGYGGSYLDLYLAEFTSNLQNYLDNLDYAEGWTWFDEDGNALTDEEVSSMTAEDKAVAFIEGRYAKGSSAGTDFGGGRPDGMPGDGNLPGGEKPDGMPGDGNLPGGEQPDGMPGDGNLPDGAVPDDMQAGEAPDGNSFGGSAGQNGDTMTVGTPDSGTTQASGSSVDSSNYSSYEEMLESYQRDIAELEAGDEYGNNLVDLYNPLNYIGEEGTSDPAWVRIVCGAAEGDISMFNSLNLEIKMLNAGIDCTIEWQWDGGHVPSEILGDSFSLYVDEMYGKYVDGAAEVTKPSASAVTANGDAAEATGTDISSWVNDDDISAVSFTLADAVSYRTKGASKAIPGFDVMDYGQEDYVFGSSSQDARHWDKYVLTILEENEDELSGLFNNGNS